MRQLQEPGETLTTMVHTVQELELQISLLSMRGHGRGAPRPPAYHARSSRASPGSSPRSLCSGIGATVHHWDGHWRAGSPASPSHDTDSPYGDKSAVRCPPCGGGDGSAAWGQVA